MKLDLEALAVRRAEEQLDRLGIAVISQPEEHFTGETCPVCKLRPVRGRGRARICPTCRARGMTATPCAAGCGGSLTKADRVSHGTCKACRAKARAA